MLYEEINLWRADTPPPFPLQQNLPHDKHVHIQKVILY